MKKEKPQTIQVVERTFDLLELLAAGNMPVSTKVLAEQLGISVQSANNLLRVLFRRGYVSQDPSRHYRLGPQLCVFGNSTARWEQLRKMLEPVLIQLNHHTGLGAFAGLLENDRLYCCAQILPNGEKESLSCQFWTGELHSTASGRILLAELSSAERKKLFARTTRRQVTPKTVVDLKDLENICRLTQKNGYAEVKEESREGICSIAIPVRDFSGAVIVSIALYGDAPVWEKSSTREKKALLENAVKELERW